MGKFPSPGHAASSCQTWNTGHKRRLIMFRAQFLRLEPSVVHLDHAWRKVLVCSQSKMVHLAPYWASITDKQATKLFYILYFYHDFPDKMMFDRDSRLTATFW